MVNEITDVFDTLVDRVRKRIGKLEHLPRAARDVESNLRAMLSRAGEGDNVSGMIRDAVSKTVGDSKFQDDSRETLRHELNLFCEELGDFQFSLTRPYFTLPEMTSPGEGGLLSITVNPYTCKGCMECVEVCDDDALQVVEQTDSSLESLRRQWDVWQDLPTTPKKYIRADVEQGIGALETILLDKRNYSSLASGDGACLGCGEKSIVHLFTATVEALMQPRVTRHIADLTKLIEKLEQHIHRKLVHEIDLSDPGTITKIIDDVGNQDLTLAGIAERVERQEGGEPIDQHWLRRVTGLLQKLKELKWKYVQGTTGKGRSSAGILNATGCSSVWGSTFPYNPYPFPWANHLFQDAASMAMGIFEGHMRKMADGFKAIRLVERELAGSDKDDADDLTYFDWRHFSDEEWELCPPVVALGGDGAMYDIGFQNLSRAMMSGKPIKVLVLDTQVYSNTGGQACTSGFFGQVSDMAQFGKTIEGKQEIRKEIGLIGMAHRTTYVFQGTIAHPSHVIEGFIEGLNARRPALFNLYTPCQPEHGIGDGMSAHQARLAVESRAYPIYKYDPERGDRPEDCIDLEGNPALQDDWPTYELTYSENGRTKKMELPMTFADFALTETRFRKHFRVAPQETWNEKMMPLAEFLELPDDEREERFPFVWTVNRQQKLTRLLVAHPIVQSCEDRRSFWHLLRAIARVGQPEIDHEQVTAQVRAELSGKLAAGIMQLLTGSPDDVPEASGPIDAAPSTNGSPDGGPSADYMAPWIDTPECTSCDECVKLNPRIFQLQRPKGKR